MAKIRECLVDKVQYQYCPHCNGNNSAETWRFLFCSDNCRNINSVFEGVRDNKISEDEARTRLASCNLDKIETFGERYKTLLKPIVNKKVVKTPVVETVVEETVEPEVVEEVAKPAVKVSKRRRSEVTADIDE